jgi:hypothetical protein
MSENISHSVNSTNLADILERVLDKGIVIAGDIRIQIADIDLLIKPWKWESTGGRTMLSCLQKPMIPN